MIETESKEETVREKRRDCVIETETEGETVLETHTEKRTDCVIETERGETV